MRNTVKFFFVLICFCLLVCCSDALIPRASAATEMTASENCVEFIKQVEGFSPQPYYDYNQYTVGYGTKCPTEKYFDYRANGIPRSEAETLLRDFLTDIADTLNKKLIDKYNLTLSQHQFDALVSFSFNIGTGWMTYDSTLRNAILTNGSENDLVYAFGLYCTAGGKYLPGLITRRLCEANMYLNGVYHQNISDAYGYVYYDANGGSLTYRVQGYICDTNTVPVADALRNGDVFLGWYTDVTGGSQVTILDRTVRGKTLFARWQSSEMLPEQDAVSTTVQVTGDVVNVRSGPSTGYSVVRKAYQNEVLTVSHVSHLTSMKWGKIQDGWICLDYTNYDAVISGNSNADQESPTDSSNPPAETETGNNSEVVHPPVDQVLVSGIVKVNDALRIRSGPGTAHSVVGFLFNGKEVDILEWETVGTTVWGRISKGWICMDYVITDSIFEDTVTEPDSKPPEQPEQIPEEKPEQAPEQKPEQIPEQVPAEPPQQETVGSSGNAESVGSKGTVKADALRIRSAPGTNNRIVGFYYQNDSVEISEKVLVDSVFWGRTHKGWVNMEYILLSEGEPEAPQPTAGETMTVIADCLRVRKGTGTDFRISALLYYGDTVTVLETVSVDGTLWGRVDKGWICMEYVK